MAKRLQFKDNFAHFGYVKIQWGAKTTEVQLEIRDEHNRLAFTNSVSFLRA